MKKTAGITLILAMTIGLAACEQASSPSPLWGEGRGEGSLAEEPQPASGLSQSAQEFPFQKILCFGDSITFGYGIIIKGGCSPPTKPYKRNNLLSLSSKFVIVGRFGRLK